MKTPKRSRSEVIPTAAEKQAASANQDRNPPVCDPSEIAKDWMILRLGRGDEDLWASREGLLYLWNGDQGYHLPRVVSTAEAQEWIAAHGVEGWCEPYFPEDSPAEKLLHAAGEPPRRNNAAAEAAQERLRASEPDESSVRLLRMETPIRRTVSLLKLFAWEAHRRKDDSFLGVVEWADDCAAELRGQWGAARGGKKKVKDFGVVSDELVQCQRAFVGLEQAVARADVLLQMMAGELAFEEKENLDNEASAPAYMALADECVGGLKTCWREAEQAWNALVDPLTERLKLKAA